MKSLKKYAGICLIIVLLSISGVSAQSPVTDTTKSTTAANAPASGNPAVVPGPNAQKDKPVNDAAYKSDDSGKWGLLGLLGLLGLFGLRRNKSGK